ncbi:MAG: alpha-N-arabinofuranosidase [Chloroflexota bacterium]|nr:alpha-N-arabinofuranosidase [Chloroflexota bacterium]MDE2858174.1 alpha-N-arabinofuranosidase [Chloroflexota bacterium]
MNQIKIDPERQIGGISRKIFGGFAEHLGRHIYGGIYEPGSPLADENGFRKDVLAAVRRLKMPVIRYPGGNFVSGYRWRDGVGPKAQRPARVELAWQDIESNHFGTDEFVAWCRALGTEPYLVVNAGDGDMREARDWVEYCNSATDSALANMRRANGFDAPHNVKYWGIGNEVDGEWQIGHKTPDEYARTYKEFAKVMRWVDPSIKLIAAVSSGWSYQPVERTQLLFEAAADFLDYLSLHWYVGNHEDDYEKYMTLSEFFEAQLSAFEGVIAAMRHEMGIERPISIALDEWNVWYRARGNTSDERNNLEERYNLEDALVVAMHFNAFIRHCRSVRMANIAQIVNVIAPIFTNQEGLFLQTIFHPFELYASNCGDIALDVFWKGDTFSGGDYTGIRTLDVSATIDTGDKKLSLFVVNRSLTETLETRISLADATFAGNVTASVVNGPDIKAENSFEQPELVMLRESRNRAAGKDYVHAFEPHSVTALVFEI